MRTASLASPAVAALLALSCGGIADVDGGAGVGAGFANETTHGATSSTTTSHASSIQASSSSSATGGLTGCQNFAPCASSGLESISFDGPFAVSSSPQIVRAWVFHGKGGGDQVQMTACFMVAGKDISIEGTFDLSSSPAAVGQASQSQATLQEGSAIFSGSTPSFSAAVTKIGDLGGLIEGTFSGSVNDGSTTLTFTGAYSACRQVDLYAP